MQNQAINNAEKILSGSAHHKIRPDFCERYDQLAFCGFLNQANGEHG
jgi:hypothetical protein